MDLANRDQALKLIWRELCSGYSPEAWGDEDLALEFGRRVLALAESKEELAKRLGG